MFGALRPPDNEEPMIIRSTVTILLLCCGCSPAALPDPLPAGHPANSSGSETAPSPGGTLDLEAAAKADAVLPAVAKKRAGHGHHHMQHGGGAK